MVGKQKKPKPVNDGPSDEMVAHVKQNRAAFRNKEYQQLAEDAARQYAAENVSDPFAYGRAMLRLREGYELPSDVKKFGLRE